MCNCIGWCRDFSEMEDENKSIKPSIHHPNCEDYKLVKYARISFSVDGCLITDVDMVDEIIDAEVDEGGRDRDDCTVTYIYMTVDQYESLPDFNGF